MKGVYKRSPVSNDDKFPPTPSEKYVNLHGWRKIILRMGAGQLDLWLRVSHPLIITLLLSCFNDDIKIENFVYESLMI